MIEKKIVCAFDVHYPYHNKKSINILLNVIKDLKPDTFIFGGDQLDFNCISTYNNGKPRRLQNQTLMKDYKGFKEVILNPITDVLPKDCEKVWITGNHENRTSIYADYYPTTEGLIEPEINLKLDDWEIISYNQYYKVNKDTIILHGLYHNEYHSKKHLEVFGCNVYYGHTHNYSVYSRKTPVDKLPKKAVSIGCLSDLNPHYSRDYPNNWINQFLVLYKNDNVVYDNIVTIQKSKTIFDSRVYE